MVVLLYLLGSRIGYLPKYSTEKYYLAIADFFLFPGFNLDDGQQRILLQPFLGRGDHPASWHAVDLPSHYSPALELSYNYFKVSS